ncbi:DNA replication/repair protein RecF [Thiopseudomonas denitrificans]|uniref:DNA replication and repair protein RecF n=1 Tax=Thiopseudomonas denitrificans TaxID=1501432 RepID=A0A4R6TZ71_9GAMM|nr:DNA replication/repair protein RecF [Thiopseudomonas denitrificans]TDQ37275.1 DNA replication and repair protein RecF [Thiopseudomonas denitrificans]
MTIRHLTATGVRNLAPVALDPSPRINLLYGCNGSGKTSFLEAIYFLALARSFRSARIQPMIQQDQEQVLAFARITTASGDELGIGVSRNRQADIQIRINGENIRSMAELARHLPVQLINPESFRLLEGAPKIRRQFLDWGVFHVEHSFMHWWQRLQHSLKQRNSLLRHAIIDDQSLQAWNLEFCAASEQIDQFRQDYIRRLKPVFTRTLSGLIDLPGLSLSYYRGWDKDKSLQQVLDDSIQRDRQLGHTQAGPQRADLRLRIGQQNVMDILSRGQQKLVVCALKIAQGHLLAESMGQQCVYLVDDLTAELDPTHRKALCCLLEQLDCQVFITGTDPDSLNHDWRKDTPVSMFHVEHGHIKESGVTE